ncbi:MAG: glycosyltransferase [Leptolyngbyaceae cyanobacterium SL_1_1]|nr:glycosyltransferase [Leptolyngbyaceae cyanobacterium SL_1_1]
MQSDELNKPENYEIDCPLISIVTPSYNQGQFIEETIRSVLLQNYTNIEYIIIDGGSCDDTLEIIKKYDRWISYWTSESDEGPSEAINKGWNRARGEILAYINSDDAYLPNALLSVAKAFHENPQASAICGNEIRVDKSGFFIKKSEIKNVSYLSLLNLEFIPQPSTFIRRNIIKSVGGINTKIKYIFDFELLLRVSRQEPIKEIRDCLAITRWHDETITVTRRSKIGEELVTLVTDELSDEELYFEKSEKTDLLVKVNLLALALCLEEGKLLKSLRYAFNLSLILPVYKFIIKIIYIYVLESYRFFKKALSIRKKLTLTKNKKHWSNLSLI